MSHGIKETKEALIGLMVLAEVIGLEIKDGFQAEDLPKIIAGLLADADKKAKLEAAVSGISNAPVEISDLQLSEGIELGIVLIQGLPGLLAALKK